MGWHEDAAALIWRCWRDGETMEALPAALRPATREEGYAIQFRLEAAAGCGRAGWKIAATSEAGQRHINVDGPIAGLILAQRVRRDGAGVSLNGNRMRVAEPEFAFRFAAALPPREAPYDVEEVLAAVGSLHPALELPDSRFLDFTAVGGPSLIADDACGRDLVVGPAARANWRDVDLARHPVRAQVGGRYDREGSGAAVLGDPRAALTWLANELSRLGVGIREGEIATTGTCMVPLEIAPGDHVEADFGALGTVSVWIADAR